MSEISPSRPSRRAAARRNIIAEESDDEGRPAIQDDAEDDFNPAPQRSPRRQSRRKTVETPATPRSNAKRRTSRARESIEPSQVLIPDENEPTPESPTKRASPAKRRSGLGLRKNRRSTQVSKALEPTPELAERKEAVLNDITQSTINEQPPQAADGRKDFVPVKALDSVMEKPMDIVIRSRALPPAVQEDTGPRPRTVIKNLILHNFKSYAGKQEVGPFHASFSSVVGPNGSGKSNVIDSLLFVFGFRASKMRQGKISALIHNSAAFPNLDYCEVEVHFQEVMDQPNGVTEALANSDLIISRKAFKNNSSKYYINARESNFTDVTGLLKAKGVDLDHKRFLILQGEVESIAQMKPKAANEHDDGLLEYLEDIIGTSRYKTPIDEAAAEVDTLNEVCSEKVARVQHVEKEKNGLEDKKTKALGYVADENDLAMKQSALYQVYTQECGDNVQVTQEAMEQMQGNLNAELQKHSGSEEGINKLQKLLRATNKDLENLQRETQIVLKEMAKHDKESVKQEEKRKFLSNKHTKLGKTLQTCRLAGSEAKNLLQKHTDDVQRKSDEVAELEQETQQEEVTLTTIREGLKGKTQAFSDEIAAKQKQMEPWNEKISAKQSAIAVAQSELDILNEKASSGAVALEEAQNKLTGAKESRQAKRDEGQQLKIQIKDVEKKVKDATVEVDRLTQQEPSIRSKLSGARQKADEARASFASTQSQGNVLNGLMRLKESGRISGFHGRLGDLGTIDQKYDVAISTACPSLQNLVVDSVDVGQQCIGYLRKNNLGRANFILLDKLPRRDLSQTTTPEGVPRLFDLVKPRDEMFRPAFFSVLQNTLVAKDLEQANRIAYGAKRWRVVTLDGQLIDISGTMSGGGTRVAKGAMSHKLTVEVTKDQVSKLEVDRDQLEQTLQAHLEEQRNAEVNLKELSSRLPILNRDLQKLVLDCQSLDKNVADAERRVSELADAQPASHSDEARIAGLAKEISKHEKDIEKLRAETAGLEEEIKELQSKIMEVGGVRLRTQKAKVDGLKQQIDTLNEEISNCEIAKSKAAKQGTKHAKTFEETEKELAGVSQDLESLENEFKDHDQNTSDLRRMAEEAKETLSNKEEELAAVKTELEQKTTELNETRAVEIEMRNELEQNTKVQAENQKRLKYWNEKLSKLTLQSLRDLGEEAEVEELPQYTRDELLDMDKDSLKGEIAILEEKISNVNVDLGVLAEYRRRVEEHSARSSDLQTAVTQRDMARKRCDELRKLRLEGFMIGFSTISARLKEMYQMITMGGNAELELVDSLDPFSEGILFSVMPPKKSWKNISNLSGGEKTLSSLALVFALHHYKPTPLYVMDEIDAALDFRNVSIVASYIKERTKNAQFIVISLRNNMFELASRLVGVYKVNHMTKSVTVENRDYITGRPR